MLLNSKESIIRKVAKYDLAVTNIVKNCMRLTPADRLVVVTDKPRLDIGEAIAKGAETICPTNMLVIEDFVERPAKEIPQKMVDEITNFHPTASIYAATGQEGELQTFRSPLRHLLTETLHCRHGHMISIDEKIMLDGMSKDYQKIQNACKKLSEILIPARGMHLTDPHGTNLEVTFNKNLKWVLSDGLIDKSEKWSNLPDGEVFTCPENANGKVVAWEVGDYFSDKYGLLDKPITLIIENSFVTRVESENKQSLSLRDKSLVHELEEYLYKYENGNRMGEFAVGCLLGLTKLIGNLLQDEKFPGIHMAFGHPYPELTGQKEWDAPTHVDVIPLNVTAEIDRKLLLKDGEFVVDLT